MMRNVAARCQKEEGQGDVLPPARMPPGLPMFRTTRPCGWGAGDDGNRRVGGSQCPEVRGHPLGFNAVDRVRLGNGLDGAVTW